MSSSTAELVTERLVLRSWGLSEAEAVLGEVRSAGWAEDFPAEGDRVIAGLLGERPEWLGPYGHRLIIERETGLVVGSLGLFWPPGDGELEIGYGVVASRRGRGYASEATRALAAYGLGAPGVRTVFANVEPSNPGSVRVLEKAGFRRVSGDGDTVRFDLTRGS